MAEDYEKRALAEMFEDTTGDLVEIPVNKQDAKKDMGKMQLSLVPASLERAVEEIRQIGIFKYKDPDNWKNVSEQRYFEAMLRHINAMREHGIHSLDEESGCKHLHHVACNVAFIIEFANMKENKEV